MLGATALAAATLAACQGGWQASTPVASTPSQSATTSGGSAATEPSTGVPSPSSTSPSVTTHRLELLRHESFEDPWAMAFLPGTDALLITQRGGKLLLRDERGVEEVGGAPEDLAVAGQGGLGDVIVGPRFSEDATIYLSWVSPDDQGRTGAVVGRGTLDVEARTLDDLTVIWRQQPKTTSDGHFSHRLAIYDNHLFVSSGDRREMTPAQSRTNTLGAIVRLTLDGDPAPGNPWADEGSPADELWSIGHRNALGLAFDADGRLWSSEMGPKGGDEINLIEEGGNYGWPEASNGSHYDGSGIPDHEEGDGFVAPKVSWNPSISPGSLMIYDGDLFPAWRGDAFVGALSGEALHRIDLDGASATKAEHFPMGQRIRAVAQGPDGTIWLLEDGADASLIELRPA